MKFIRLMLVIQALILAVVVWLSPAAKTTTPCDDFASCAALIRSYGPMTDVSLFAWRM